MKSGVQAGAILREAVDIVEGNRDQVHGNKERSFNAIAGMWSVYLANRRNPAGPIRPHDVAHMLVLLKMERAEWGTPVRDHWIDAAGYCGVAGELWLFETELIARTQE